MVDLFNKGLKSNSIAIIFYLLLINSRAGTRRICAALNMHRGTGKKKLQQLVDLGLIRKERGKFIVDPSVHGVFLEFFYKSYSLADSSRLEAFYISDRRI
jgi:predicted transcriptional regulator